MTQMPPNREVSTLFVPMHLDALVMNSTIRISDITYNRWQMNYEQINQFGNPMPDEFVDQKLKPPANGVHLHWTLPAGLTHGVENSEGNIDFPFVPNRWLVIRLQPGQGSDGPGAITSWVVLSDAIGKDCTSRFMEPFNTQPGEVVAALLGKKVDLQDWDPDMGAGSKPFLKAIAPGNVTFAAFAPGVENVFAFYDDLQQVPAQKLTYLVVGWYSQPEKMDPLNNLPLEAWQSKFLCNISSQFQKELDQNDPSPILRQVFKDHEIDLPAKPNVSIDRPGSAWRIINGSKTYTLRKSDRDINIYDSTVTVVDPLGWAVELNGASPPRRTLVHGLIYDLDWKPEGHLSKPNNIPSRDDISRGVRIAVGNTSIDALTALIENQVKNNDGEEPFNPDFLEAFQYNLLSTLDQVGSKTLLDQQIRGNWFGSDPGGIRWQIVAQEDLDHQAGKKQPKITPVQATRLVELNRQQRKLDAERRILASMQWELYALWWKYKHESVGSHPDSQAEPGSPKEQPPTLMDNRPTPTPSTEGGLVDKPGSMLGQIIQSILQLIANLFGKKEPEPQPQEEPDETEIDPTPLPQKLARELDLGDPNSFASKVQAQKDKVARLAKSVPIPTGPRCENSIKTYALIQLELDPKKLALKPSEMPRFWHPTDPVVLISGLGRPTQQGREGNLLCRLASHLIDGITLPSQDESIRLSSGDLKNLIPSLSNEHLPAGISQLLSEAFFLDLGNAEFLAKACLPSLVTIEAVGEAIRNIQATPPQGTRGIGRCGAKAWEQPWSPLFLDWQVGLYYTFERKDGAFVTNNEGNFIFASTSWQFDGTEFHWTGPNPSPQHVSSYSGRTFLTPHAPLTFLDRLRKYLQSQPNNDIEADEDFLKRIADWDVLSQTLSGFSDLLIMRDLEFTVPPFGPLSDLIGDHLQGVPYTEIGLNPGPKMPFFFPFRAGFMKFEDLRIIDKYGRTLDLLFANNNDRGSKEKFNPIRGRGMIPSQVNDKGLVALPPRLVQSSRLSFRFISATDDSQETGLAVESNPVCGWLLPNHINKSIVVYRADGEPLGELLLIRRSKTENTVTWVPAPGVANLPPEGNNGQHLQISNPHLKNMVEALIHHGDAPAAFDNLLGVIDETLWTIDPLGERDDQNLSVLIGRPLALVRANLQLELKGKPYFNQAWYETFVDGSGKLKENHGGLLDLDVPVRLGSQELRNDGLIGYFQDTSGRGTDYTQFHAVHEPNSNQPANPTYICQIGANQDYIKLKFKATTPVLLDPAGSVYLTMLVDPRGVVHANSGLLPTKIVELPVDYIQEALERMAVTFRAGPLLLEPDNVRLPLAAEQHGTWTWVQATGTQQDPWFTAPIEKADGKARFSTSPLNLVEGWLKFTPDEIDNNKEMRDGKKTA